MNLSQLIVGKRLDDCSVEELKNIVNEYPYFSAAQLLLTQKLKAENDEGYLSQLDKTALHFPDVLWLDHLLNNKGQAVETAGKYNPSTEPPPFHVFNPSPVVEMDKSEMNVESLQDQNETVVTSVERIDDDIRSEDTVTTSANNEEDPETNIETDEPPLNIPAPKWVTVKADSALTFEPYHTVDYFASQGIRVKEEAKPTDKFGKQLLSFTEWLKTMKKLPATAIEKNLSTDTGAEKKVEQMAEHSIEAKEVVTEAMAEVWEKQGNYSKAIEVYNKLSLLNPSKSAYFAAKIDNLKTP